MANQITPIRDVKERFWSKVRKAGDDECWEWQSYKSTDGYGLFSSYDRKLILAHRFAYELTYGQLPSGRKDVVMHSCDNRSCCNPRHLSVGTQSENIIHMRSIGHGVDNRGSHHGMSKLTEAQVIEIKSLVRQGVMIIEVAKRFNTTPHHISDMMHGRRWKHIP